MIYTLKAKKCVWMQTALKHTFKICIDLPVCMDILISLLNYGLRYSHWNFNKETIVSPRISLGIIPAFDDNLQYVCYWFILSSTIFKELRDTTTIDGTTYATLNNKIKSQAFHSFYHWFRLPF